MRIVPPFPQARRAAPTHRRPHRRPIAVATVALAITAMAAVAELHPSIATTPAAGAQAAAVSVLVHTFPARPQPDQDVEVVVDIDGCAQGPVTVELLRTADDGAERSVAAIDRTAARTTLLFRTRALLELPDATMGWYGVRVLCGTFRPRREPMTGSLFAVGAGISPQASAESTVLSRGGSVTLSGDRCDGDAVEYELIVGAGRPGPFEPDGLVGVDADQRWTADVPVPEDSPLGPAQLRARCATARTSGLPLYTYYDVVRGLSIES